MDNILHDIIHELTQENDKYKKDLMDACGELLIEIPEPHSDLAKLVTANRRVKQ